MFHSLEFLGFLVCHLVHIKSQNKEGFVFVAISVRFGQFCARMTGLSLREIHKHYPNTMMNAQPERTSRPSYLMYTKCIVKGVNYQISKELWQLHNLPIDHVNLIDKYYICAKFQENRKKFFGVHIEDEVCSVLAVCFDNFLMV